MPTRERWDRTNFALIGGMVGGLIMFVHGPHHVMVDADLELHSFQHMMLELIGGALVGAGSFALVAQIRNWIATDED
jgi:hypothetical protein